MSQKEILEKLLEPMLEKAACDLVELEIKGSPSNRIFRFYVDHDEGITIQECASLSRSILNRLENMPQDFPPDSFRIEVSSPGADRPLKTMKDFKRNIGKDIILSFMEAETIQNIEGKISEVKKTSVLIETANQKKKIDYSKIKKAHVKINWS